MNGGDERACRVPSACRFRPAPEQERHDPDGCGRSCFFPDTSQAAAFAGKTRHLSGAVG
ncbi:hypothetical protein [Komagataeibacter oboediens]